MCVSGKSFHCDLSEMGKIKRSMIFCERGREGRRKGHERLRVFCNKLLFVMHVLSLRLGNPLGSSNQTIRIHGKEICEFLCAMNKARVRAEKDLDCFACASSPSNNNSR